jgi:type IV pilus assembly protein PilN
MQGRLPLNLASEPFRRDRAILIASSALAVLLAIGLAVLVSLVLSERQRAKDTREALFLLERDTRAQAAEIARYDGILRQVQNAEVLDRNVFINTLISRKAVSWTLLFSDLEKVIPHNVRLVSVRPQILANNQIILDMTVGSQSESPVVDMLMRLEGSPLFGATSVQTMLPPSQNETLYRYRLSVNYAPKY